MSVPHRVREAHPHEFEPSTIFFTTFPNLKDEDWNHCYHLKAIAVYRAISGKEVNIHDTCKLFTAIARECHGLIKAATTNTVAEPTAQTTDAATVTAAVPTAAATVTAAEYPPEPAAASVKSSSSGEWDKCGEGSPSNLTYGERKTADSVFLVLGFLRELHRVTDREQQDKLCLSKHTQYAISDIIKQENQIPLDDIKQVVHHLEAAVKWAIEPRMGKPLADGFKLELGKDNLDKVLYHFCCYYSPFQKMELDMEFQHKLHDQTDLLTCLHYSLKAKADKHYTDKLTSHRGWTPTVKQLARTGIRFNSDAGDITGIKFMDKVLHLPELVFDHKLETVLWNLVALETHQDQKPVTKYIQLLNELVEDLHDVRILSKFGCVRGRLSKGEEVGRFVKMLNGFAGFSSIYPPIDKEIEKAKEFYTERMGRFLVRNRPAVIWVSYVAAASLVLTAVITSRRRG